MRPSLAILLSVTAAHVISVGDIAQFKPGVCGMKYHQMRISTHADWIDQTIKGESTTAHGK